MGCGRFKLDGLSPSHLRALIVAFLAAANVFVLTFSAYTLQQSREKHEEQARTLTQNIAQAVDYSLSNSVEKIDLALKSIADELQHELSEKGIDPARIDAMLAKYQERLPEVEGIRLSDATGRVILGKGVDPKASANWADRDYFPYLRDHPDAGLNVSPPRMGRVAKKLIVGFERRYNRPDGSFAGVVAAPVAIDHFNTLLSRFDIRGKGLLALRGNDLGLIVRYPAVAGPVGDAGNVMASDKLQELVRSGVGAATYDATLAVDQREWKVSFRRLKAAPMIILVGVAKGDYLAEWHAEVVKTALVAASFLLLSFLSGWLVLHLQARMARESARNRLYLHHASDGIHILDDHGNLLQASDRFCAMLGYGREEMLGMSLSCWEAGWPSEVLRTEVFPGWLRQDASATFETYHRRKDGTLIDVEVNVVGFESDGKRRLFASSRDIGEKKLQQQALISSEARLRQSEERYRLLLQNSPVGILHYDTNLVVTYANDRFEDIMRVPRGHMAGLDCTRLHDQSVVPPMRQAIAGQVTHYEGPYITSHGHLPLIIAMRCAPVMTARGEILGGIVILEDITERKRAESQMRLAASVFAHAHEGIMICDAHQVVLDVNPTFSEITGYGRNEVIGRTPAFLSSGRQDSEFYRAMWQAIREQGHWEGEVWNRRKDGSIYAERLAISSVVDDGNQVTHYIGTFSDISLLKRHQAELERLAHYDALTRLPNRALLSDRMTQALAQAKRSGALLAVCYLDLDGFKAINDELGHDAGDALLIEVAQRLRDMIRAGDTVARLGGDEFVVLLIDVASHAECERAATRILRSVATPMHIKGHERAVSGSLGISLFPDDGADSDTLLRNADQAMYLAKQAGKNRHIFFDSSSSHRARDQQEAVARVQQAMASGELGLHYQPIVDMRRGRVLGLEGLLRWRHPERGLLLPADFLPLIQGSDLEIELGRWVLALGLRQLSEWRRLGLNQYLALNISSGHLLSPDFADELAALLAAHPDLEPRALEIEILETSAMEDLETVVAVARRCHDMGVDLALDDFGTGHSSLACFRRLPVDTLKIDQVFVQSVLGDPEDLAIVESVVGLTRAFNRKLVAEGVETVEIGMLLLNLGCSVGQGFGIARPMPAEEVPAWVAGFVPDANWSLPVGEIAREDMPLFMAELEHRAWVRRLGDWLDSDRQSASLPPQDSRRCRFGQWYGGPGRKRFGHFPSFQAVGELHEEVHRLGHELVRLASEGREDEARQRFQEVTALRDQLVECLASLHAELLLESI